MAFEICWIHNEVTAWGCRQCLEEKLAAVDRPDSEKPGWWELLPYSGERSPRMGTHATPRWR